MTIEEMMPLKALRIRSGLKQKDVAKSIEISVPTLRKWEQNAEDMPLKYMDLFSKFYNYPKDRIFFGDIIAFSDKKEEK